MSRDTFASRARNSEDRLIQMEIDAVAPILGRETARRLAALDPIDIATDAGATSRGALLAAQVRALIAEHQSRT